MRNFSVLSDLDFESVVSDLIAGEVGTHVERFARGADGGIDLRWRLPGGQLAIAQCKHYFKSSFSQLLASAKDEVSKVKKQAPGEYRFYTSFDLTVSQKQKIYELFSSWMSGPELVYGGRDIDGELTRNGEVERRHIKLWLSTGTELFWATNSELASRSSMLRTRLERTLNTYIEGDSYEESMKILDEHNVCLIAGVPGIGKSALAQMLVASYLALGYQPIEVSEDIKEAWAALDTKHSQIFFYDDFLGQISFSERMGKNEDSRLANFIDAVGGMKHKKLVMTTREYILRDARRDYRRLVDLGDDLHFILELDDYSRLDRAQILYSHLWHADVSVECLAELSDGGWKRIVDHSGYNPRLIEYCTGPSFDSSSKGYLDRFVDILTHPEELWRNAYERHLIDSQKALLLTLASMPVQASHPDLQAAYLSFCSESHLHANAASFRSSLEMLEMTFISIAKRGAEVMVSFHSPSVAEFILDQIREDPATLSSLIASVVFFEQLTALRNATGEDSSFSTSASSGVVRHMPINLFGDEFTEALMGTFESPSPVKILNQSGYVTGYEDPYGLFENRLEAVLGLEPELRPPNTWIESRLVFLADRWKNLQGEKSDAIRLYRKVSKLQKDRSISVSEEVLAEFHETLESWLSSSLEGTSDWSAFVDFNSFEDVDDIDDDIRDQFLDHALSELDAWDPSPPDLNDLVELAELFDVYPSIEESVAEAHQREEEHDAKQEDDSHATRYPRSRMSETGGDIDEMFNRFKASES
ncbi:hypothetical protein [Rhodococcus erythropolis]|uniref:nSTAND3 domain-containing NTPase n=1 Tax=Rhodococcus erythropolis TaxID=1833 RepID=UPI0024B6D20F|nr:hypothetical protein [Rhodococcus erythropolis]MDJ0010706.1 hypothetical protein [Rhodococcus erythropolis]